MDEFNMMRRSHVPAFGSWEDSYGDLPAFTQCFESASRQAGLLHYRYNYSEDRDLYVAGDLYQNDVVTPAVIVVPRRRREKRGYRKDKEGEKEGWVCNYDNELKAPKAKAVDEDLYKISPDLLCVQPKKKRAWGFLSCCLRPTRVNC